MKKIAHIIFFLLIISCNSQKKEQETRINENVSLNNITKIVFSEISTSEPVNGYSFSSELLVFSADSLFLIEEKYKGEKIIDQKKIKSLSYSNKDFFSKIPIKYLKSGEYKSLNYYPENDGDMIKAFIYYKDNTVVNWSFKPDEEGLPKDLRFVYDRFTDAKRKLHN